MFNDVMKKYEMLRETRKYKTHARYFEMNITNVLVRVGVSGSWYQLDLLPENDVGNLSVAVIRKNSLNETFSVEE